jgi:RNase H-fold protein (predicted Holliday junction resolvase)
MTEKTVLAIDPGTSKCGMALVHRNLSGTLKMIWSEVVPSDKIVAKIQEAELVSRFQLIIVGGGTSSHAAVAQIRETMPSMGILVVDEANTSLEARERYWEHHPRRGWRRFLPATLQVPPEPVDHFVAMILAERVLLEA